MISDPPMVLKAWSVPLVAMPQSLTRLAISTFHAMGAEGFQSMRAGGAGSRANVDPPVPLARGRARGGALKSVPGDRGSIAADLLVASFVAKRRSGQRGGG